uniref:Uncharacterized protein n=1 Tax=Rhizophora mucronata TaxID=61149 RepID=A0A2P2J383_RHIMU
MNLSTMIKTCQASTNRENTYSRWKIWPKSLSLHLLK